MSVIAARVENNKIVMAADSIICRGWSKRTNGFAKIMEINGMIIGGTGECQEMSLIYRYMQTHKPESTNIRDVLSFVIDFSKWKSDLIGESKINNTYILAYGGHLFSIEQMFVNEIEDFFAVGAGEDFASAALYLGHTPKEAVMVACKLCCFVSEPIIEFEQARPIR